MAKICTPILGTQDAMYIVDTDVAFTWRRLAAPQDIRWSAIARCRNTVRGSLNSMSILSSVFVTIPDGSTWHPIRSENIRINTTNPVATTANGGANNQGRNNATNILSVTNTFQSAANTSGIRCQALATSASIVRIVRVDGLPDEGFNCNCESSDVTIQCSGQQGGICCISKATIQDLCNRLK